MNITTLTALAALAAFSVTPAFAQVPPTNATIEGTQGPNANGTGYPSAAVQAGRIGTSGTAAAPAPMVMPNPGNVAAGQPTNGTANGVDQTPGTPK